MRGSSPCPAIPQWRPPACRSTPGLSRAGTFAAGSAARRRPSRRWMWAPRLCLFPRSLASERVAPGSPRPTGR
eukprot:10659866-Lingulodinium_polyedra.AAC.1